MDKVGSGTLLNALSVCLGGYDLLSLATQKFPAGKINQTSRFSNASIGLRAYTKLLDLLSTGALQAHIDSIIPFQQIAVAQNHVKNEPVQGRLLLAY
jgi:NADPH:quinone reductase-like Zn-dependent oxidoreductase